MTLSPEQKQAVSAWVAAGDNLSAIQKKLAAEFKVSMTYMDVRFLVDDLGLELKNAAPKADASDLAKGPAAGAPPGRAPGERKGLVEKLKEKVGLGQPDDEDELPPEDLTEPIEEEPAAPVPGGPSTLKLELDRVVRPGAAVSGSVTFSDGISGKWALDPYGRLVLETSRKGYQPSPADVQAFQRELQSQLQRHGY